MTVFAGLDVRLDGEQEWAGVGEVELGLQDVWNGV